MRRETKIPCIDEAMSLLEYYRNDKSSTFNKNLFTEFYKDPMDPPNYSYIKKIDIAVQPYNNEIRWFVSDGRTNTIEEFSKPYPAFKHYLELDECKKPKNAKIPNEIEMKGNRS